MFSNRTARGLLTESKTILMNYSKSAVQAIAGDKEGAWETQINFLETFPVESTINIQDNQ